MYLELKNVSKSFGEKEVVKDLSLSLPKGELLCLLGASGCGKTTTLKMISGFLKTDEGQILVDGQDITTLAPEKRPVSTVFQSYALFPHMSVLENVIYGLKFRGIRKKEAREMGMEYLKIVDMEEYAGASIGEISGGQQQRVALVRSLITKPKVLLLDEPLSNLDAKLRVKMREEIREIQKKYEITMVFVTHDQEEAINMSDRIAVMNKGTFEQIGTPDEIYNHPKTSYVATFVGNANILKGKVVEINGSYAQVQIGNDTVSVYTEEIVKVGEQLTLAVRSENILLQETAVIGDTGTDHRDTVDISVSGGGLDAHNKNSVSGLQATVTEKNFAGGQLRVTLKLSDGTQLIASRYGIDASVAEGQTVRCSFLPADAVLVDREDIHEEA